ncbi:ABC transporter ATP-binding protein [Filibacter tadaridae]|uniref:Putative ABC transporter ATP-binding protein YxlF n=1 Tax=Filibacter tadaridae TaxID=2483811 RepID=A0A3P5WYP1_9BACL|nr:ABC transporter ATP-binding protein [Filibacter tadaridae]VDC21087.1 putative ABC transporter ATP-binding protein YxlF [Filibacter tadaridae]
MTQLLQVVDLTKKYGSTKVVDTVSFELEEHTSTALIGPNGSGKTTTLSMLAGLVPQTSGTLQFQSTARQDIQSIIGFLPQYPKFFSWLSALEFTEMAARLSGVETRKAVMEAKKTLEFVGLGDSLSKKTGTFSGGMKQRLGLAQAIVHKPKLILLDEPVSALDPVGRRQVMNLLKEIQQETTILYSTHILNDAEEMTDQLLFLRQGKLVEQGSLDDVRSRYAEPRIIIEFEKEQELQRFTEMAPWHVSANGLTVAIDVLTEGVGMPAIIALLHGQSFLVRKIERQTASLEEIFMKVAVI